MVIIIIIYFATKEMIHLGYDKSTKTEHNGSKKGKGCYYGVKKEAKTKSKVIRRAVDKEETKVKEEEKEDKPQ